MGRWRGGCWRCSTGIFKARAINFSSFSFFFFLFFLNPALQHRWEGSVACWSLAFVHIGHAGGDQQCGGRGSAWLSNSGKENLLYGMVWKEPPQDPNLWAHWKHSRQRPQLAIQVMGCCPCFVVIICFGLFCWAGLNSGSSSCRVPILDWMVPQVSPLPR